MLTRGLRSFVALGAVLCSCLSAVAQQGAATKTFDFAGDTVGEAPASWMILPPGTRASVVEDDASPTHRSVQLGPAAQGQQVANMMQQIDATPFRGKRVIVRGDLRLAPHESTTQLRTARSQMWVRVDRAGQKQGFFDNMSDRPIRGLRALKFQTYAISGVVDDDATLLNVGFMTFGEAVGHVARFRIDAVDVGEDPNVKARALEGRGLENLRALARLYGYVRYFHPSDEAAAADWESFLAAAGERVEGAADSKALAGMLGELFTPLAPSVQVWAGGKDDGPTGVAVEGEQMAWKHHGVDVASAPSGMQVYTSKRVRVGAVGADGVAAAGTSVVKDLGGGVWCRVPVTVGVNESGATVPKAIGDAVRSARPDWWSANGKDRSARIAGVMVAWNVMEHFYPYFDVSDADWGRVLDDALTRAATDADERAYLVTIQRLVSELDDGHGNVAPLNMARPAPLDAVFDWAGDELVLVKVGEQTGQAKPGDVVTKVAGVPTAEWYKECRGRISAATEQWARWRACSDHSFFGWSNEPVELTLRRDGKEFATRIKRRSDDAPAKEERPVDGSELAPGVVYFNLDGAEAPAWQKALPKLKEAKGIVLDMRGYPGGAGMLMLRHLTATPIQSAKWKVPDSPLPDREGVVYADSGRWNLPPAQPRLGADGQRVVFVTDGRAISYAESCMGIVEAYKLGEIVGGPTAGTNGNINPFTVCGGYYIVWTGMRVIKHDDSRHHGVGIRPTIPVGRTVDGIRAGRDELLDAAVKAAQGG
jgi:C-terminal processing protease CtpA/Prc